MKCALSDRTAEVEFLFKLSARPLGFYIDTAGLLPPQNTIFPHIKHTQNTAAWKFSEHCM